MTDTAANIMADRLGDLSTKKKNQKENNRKALSLKERKDRVAHMATIGNSKSQQNAEESHEARDNRGRLTRVNARKNAEIDEYLIGLVMEGIVDENYWKFHTKAVYLLGLDKYNQMVIEARDGRKPQNLLAFKIKGAIELHYKRKLYREKYLGSSDIAER